MLEDRKKVLFVLQVCLNDAVRNGNEKQEEMLVEAVDIMLTDCGAIDRGEYIKLRNTTKEIQ